MLIIRKTADYGQNRSRPLSLGARPSSMTYRPGDTGRRLSLGAGVDGACGPPNSTGCTTYQDPAIAGCPEFNGCGDTVGISAVIGASVQGFVILIPAPWVFTPRQFLYTGPAATFAIVSVKVANGSDSHFGAPYAADVHSLTSFTRKEVSWPTFKNSPPLEIRVNNLTAAQATFGGVLIGVSMHA